MNIAVVFAGGKGTRMGSEIPKQFLEINGKPILVYTLELFQYHKMVDKIYVATLKNYINYVNHLSKEFHLNKVASVIEGGGSALDSTYRILKKASEENSGDSIVLIHDGVRPFVSSLVITETIKGVQKNGNAITSIPAYETVMISKDGEKIDDVTVRKETFIGQAPQGFYLKDILSYHEEIRKTDNGYDNIVDSSTLARFLNKEIYLVEGNRGNIKITTPEDVYTFKAFLNYKENEQTFGLGKTNKIGSQYDIMKNKEE